MHRPGSHPCANLARYLLTHPLKTVRIAQASAVGAMNLRVSYLGSYAPGAGVPPATLDNRVGIVSSIVGVIRRSWACSG
ncbi:MAG TPA: hypothetical protein VK586_19115 [Streptosporangiaceae bacterium]|nr:hypothetical protein [Streptosporangiaceae bacterium]